MALIGVGDSIHTVMTEQIRRDVSPKLLLDPPNFDGFDGLFKKLLPGLGHGASNPRVVQIVLPLPLDMAQTEDGKLTLRAPKVAVEGQLRIVVNFNTEWPATKIQVAYDGAKPTADGKAIEWHWDILWPQGAESGKASLFYAGEQVSSTDLRRWPGAGTLRAAVDCYFDPHHKRLKEAILGLDKKNSSKGKASQTFEEATVRLMNLLGVPLVWYGGQWASSARNDAAGLVDKKEKRVVVLAECTLEKPEAKFSALKDRADKLSELVGSEAEVLPVVFTRVDPPGSVFEMAVDHGLALVGRTELNSLFDMLSAITGEKDALGFLNRLKSLVPGKMGLALDG